MTRIFKLLALAALVTLANYFSIERLMEGLFAPGVEVGVTTVFMPAVVILASLAGFLTYLYRMRAEQRQGREREEGQAAAVR